MTRLLAAALIGVSLLGPAQSLAQTAPAPAEAPGAAPFLTLGTDDFLVSNMIDLSVYTDANQRVGEVEDLVMDGARGVRAVIVSVGALKGGGEHHVALDPAALDVVRAADGSYRAVIRASADQIRAAPPFRYRGAWSE